MLQKFWNKYKNSLKKDILVHILVIIGLLGIICIVLSSYLEQESSPPEQSPASESAESAEQEAYRLTLQNQLAEMLILMIPKKSSSTYSSLLYKRLFISPLFIHIWHHQSFF